MPSNFAEVGKSLQTEIPVPALPVASIRLRLRNANARHRSRMLIAYALAAIAVLGSGTVLAAITFGGIRVWLSGNRAAFAVHSFVVVQNPNAGDLRRVTTDATFPVVFPVGIPKGMHMDLLIFSPADRPNFIQVSYRNARTDARTGKFSLVDSSTVNHGEAPARPNGEFLQVAQVTHWNVGQETVIALGEGQQAQVRTAMSGITPAESLAQTLPLLYRIGVPGVQDKLADAAEAIAPSDGRSALIDRDGLRLIASLAQSRKSLVYSRATTFGTFPTVAGKIDWAHANNHRTMETAVSADGVRAIAAVLATNVCGSAASGFTCEMLVNEGSGRAYGIWVFPLNASTPPTKYTVDSTTFRVAQGG
jgi:hypothetical protein